jgi:hypothetical protein
MSGTLPSIERGAPSTDPPCPMIPPVIPPARRTAQARNREGVGLAASPSHTTVLTGPYAAVRQIMRTPAPAGGATAGVWNCASARKLRSLRRRAVGLHLQVGAQAGKYRCSAAWLHRDARIYLLSASAVQAFGGLLRLLYPLLTSPPRSRALRPAQSGLPDTAEMSRGKTEVRPTAFAARPLDLPPRPLMARGLRDHLLARPAG